MAQHTEPFRIVETRLNAGQPEFKMQWQNSWIDPTFLHQHQAHVKQIKRITGNGDSLRFKVHWHPSWMKITEINQPELISDFFRRQNKASPYENFETLFKTTMNIPPTKDATTSVAQQRLDLVQRYTEDMAKLNADFIEQVNNLNNGRATPKNTTCSNPGPSRYYRQ